MRKILKLEYLSLTILVFCLLFLSERVHGEVQTQMLPWEKVNKILPKYSKFTVIDLETGEKFRVQRRAGSRHADVQPLSSNDTKIMKQIYEGKWSWRRKAIIVKKGNTKIAASMHGMPHGAGALKNNFPGHFCIHFYGSTTHRTKSMDLSHKLMIFKAAGRLKGYLSDPDPYKIVNAYIAGLKEQDKEIVTLISLQYIQWDKILYKIDAIRITQMGMLPVEDLSDEHHLSIPIRVDWYIKKVGPKSFEGNIELVRFSHIDPWKVDSLSFLDTNGLLPQPTQKSLSP